MNARALVLGALLAGCEGLPPEAPPPAAPGPSTGDAIDPAARYAALCAPCHGEAGEGAMGPPLVDTRLSLEELTRIIDERMPVGNPDACRGPCASSLAAYLRAEFTAAAQACTTIPPSPRRLRLLSRREYRDTLRDLFAGVSPREPTPPAGAATCAQRFTYDPSGRALGSVHLAGSFNGWSATAWPLTRGPSGLWSLERALEPGEHTYKFVLDGREWVRDPANPDTVPDGFGGQNSRVRVACTGTPPGGSGGLSLPADLGGALPAETPPQGFLYDTHADSGLVTAVHLTEQLRAADAVVRALAPGTRAFAGCAPSEDREGCTESFLRRFGRRVLRRPLTASELTRYRALQRGAPDLEAGLRRVVRALLLSPGFLYRTELGAAQPDGTWRLTGWEVASALSYTFWGTTPDEALLSAAESGALDAPSGVEREARRLLASPRARARLGVFAEQWLGVASVADSPRSAADFDRPTREALLEEARRFFNHVVFDGSHHFEDLFSSDQGYYDETVARWYGLPAPAGAGWRLGPLPPERRGGVLTLGAVLARYAHSDQGSPILRGVFVRRNLLCQEFPPPPPNAGGVPEVDPRATTRERFRQHTANATCNACHRYIDGPGFAFEGYDAVGRARATENGMALDTRAAVLDLEGIGVGTEDPVDGALSLGALLGRSGAARGCFARQWYRFARGYRETSQQRCAVQALSRRLGETRDLREVLVGVVTSPDFLVRRGP
ncbi:MAG: DUF1592 domain-containing protein [Deltaproteobacteria bacterium]|nr:DUF1592 domain-containing protein [Deltaproteobacteria bacterium]